MCLCPWIFNDVLQFSAGGEAFTSIRVNAISLQISIILCILDLINILKVLLLVYVEITVYCFSGVLTSPEHQ